MLNLCKSFSFDILKWRRCLIEYQEFTHDDNDIFGNCVTVNLAGLSSAVFAAYNASLRGTPQVPHERQTSAAGVAGEDHLLGSTAGQIQYLEGVSVVSSSPWQSSLDVRFIFNADCESDPPFRRRLESALHQLPPRLA